MNKMFFLRKRVIKNLLRFKGWEISAKKGVGMGFFFALFLAQSVSFAQSTMPLVHDPSIIKVENTYHIFTTGYGITHWHSSNLKDWEKGRPVFEKTPEWVKEVVPNFKNHMWAPDISYYEGQYYLFYTVSAFGKNTSAIGVATNKTLNESDADYKWMDHGMVVRSVPGRDLWNAIDPNLITDENGDPWLSFGSFWEGIKLVKLTRDRFSIVQPEQWFTIASRERNFGIPDSLPGNAAIEAPFIFHKEGYYYLFVSYDFCCRGVNSTYKIMVGRAKSVSGPYLDKEGKEMSKGGATLLLKGNERWPGLGHNAILKDTDQDYLVFHAYDAKDHGKSKLQILPIKWESGWPEVNLED